MSIFFIIVTFSSAYDFVGLCRETFLEINTALKVDPATTALLGVGAIKATKVIGAGVLKVGPPALKLCFLCGSCLVTASISGGRLAPGAQAIDVVRGVSSVPAVQKQYSDF
jgi:hypothetical protein